MDHEQQLKVDNCGQSCIAMITGVHQFDAMNAVGKDGATNVTLLKNALFKFGYNVDVVRGKARWPPSLALLIINRKDRKTHWSHAVVLKEGYIYDPCHQNPLQVELYEVWMRGMGYKVQTQIVVLGKRW